MLEQIQFSDFTKVEMCAGTIISAKLNSKANIPAYVLEIDFGAKGLKTSSAQIVENYSAKELIGKQIIAVLNFPIKRIAGIKSEVLVLGCVSDKAATVLLSPTKNVENGARVM